LNKPVKEIKYIPIEPFK